MKKDHALSLLYEKKAKRRFVNYFKIHKNYNFSGFENLLQDFNNIFLI